MSFRHYLLKCQQQVEQALDHYLTDPIPASVLQTAMRYSVLNGGKRLRALLVYATGEAVGVETAQLDTLACAIELIHAYSLIHDDLPAMDNADLRRGQPSCHKKFDEATAILAGDALQALAFEIIAADPQLMARPLSCLSMIKLLAKNCGWQGMVGGQALDLAASGQDLDLSHLELIHRLKTGALIQASVQLPILAAPHITEQDSLTLTHFAQLIGLAFQIQDDLLDAQANIEVTGKPVGIDQINAKLTYPKLMGLTAATEKMLKLYEQALAQLAVLSLPTTKLRLLTDHILGRQF